MSPEDSFMSNPNRGRGSVVVCIFRKVILDMSRYRISVSRVSQKGIIEPLIVWGRGEAYVGCVKGSNVMV